MIIILIALVLIEGFLLGPPAVIVGCLGWILGITIITVTGKLYSTKDFRGYVQESIRFTDRALTEKALKNIILKTMEKELKARNVSAKVSTSTVVSNKWLSLKRHPMLVIKNTEFGKKYFDIGIAINNNTVAFPLLGESKENTRNNLHKMYKTAGTFSGDVKSMFYRADEFKLQNEANWQQDVLDCFNSAVLK